MFLNSLRIFAIDDFSYGISLLNIENIAVTLGAIFDRLGQWFMGPAESNINNNSLLFIKYKEIDQGKSLEA